MGKIQKNSTDDEILEIVEQITKEKLEEKERAKLYRMGAFARAFAKGLRPNRELSLSQFANEYLYNPPGTAEPGKFSIDRTPYLKEIVDCLEPNSPIDEVTIVGGAQTGKTQAMLIWLAFIMAIAPDNVIIYTPTIKLAEVFSQTKIGPTIDATPILYEMFAKDKNKNNLTTKKFKGCVLDLKGANSGNSYRMASAKNVVGDEIDSFPASVGEEGDPMELIEGRLTTYGSKAKRLWGSTPTIDGFSAIQTKFKAGDQRYYHVPCPHCGVKQALIFPNLKFIRNHPDDKYIVPGSAMYQCISCDTLIEESNKTWMLAQGEWVASNPDAPKRKRSYHISSIYSPLGWYSWDAMCNQFLESKDDELKLKVFKNTRLGECYVEKASQPNWRVLKDRAEDYQLGTVPAKAVRIYGGVDIQGDRICLLLVAFGEAMENWPILYEELPGSAADKSTWEHLNTLIRRTYRHDSGVELPVRSVAIDTGFHTHDVYDFVRNNQDLCYAVKGASTDISAIYNKSERVDVDPRTGQKFANAISLFQVNTLYLKKYLYLNLQRMIQGKHTEGEKVYHFSNQLNDNFYQMMTVERMVRRIINNQYKESFENPKKERNEVMDCYNYATTMAFMDQTHMLIGDSYTKMWEANIGKRLALLEGKEIGKKSTPVKTATSKPWMNRNGFSLKRN